MEEYDLAFKEMGLPLGFLNVSPFEVRWRRTMGW